MTFLYEVNSVYKCPEFALSARKCQEPKGKAAVWQIAANAT